MATAAPPLAQLSAASRQTNKPGRKFRENGRQILGKTVELFGKFGFVDRICSAVISAIRQDQSLLAAIESVLAESVEGDISGATAVALRDCLVAKLKTVLSDQGLPTRDRLVCLLAGEVSQNPRVRTLLKD
jgi:hypothetical protein